MSGYWICPDFIFDGTALVAGVSVRVEDGCVVGTSERIESNKVISGILSPGFVDLQVNGGGGMIVNNAPTIEAIGVISGAHRQYGTVAIMPTVITDAPEVLEAAAEAVMRCRGDDGIIGLHIEGPHIATARRGTHDPKHIRRMDERTLNVVERLREVGVPVMITLAPEAVTPKQIAQLTAMGAIVSLGHTDAKAEDVDAAIKAGASCATHLFNAMSPMQSRAAGAVGAILNAGIHAGIICDGYHVDDAMIRLALRACAKDDRLFIVSDAMATVGGPDWFDLYGRQVRLEDGRLLNQEGTLAGAHLTQARGVERLVGEIGVDLAHALRMAISIPADVMGRPDLAQLMGRSLTDCLLLSPEGQIIARADQLQ